MDKLFNIRVLARFRDDFNQRIVLACRKFEIPNGKAYRLVPKWEEIKEGEGIYYDSSIEEVVLRPEEAQALMDSLWHCGFRPTEGKGSAGAMAATEDHVKTLKEYLNRTMALVENPLYMIRDAKLETLHPFMLTGKEK